MKTLQQLKEDGYVIELTERYEMFPKKSYYKYEILGILHDTEDISEAFRSPDPSELCKYIEKEYDYICRAIPAPHLSTPGTTEGEEIQKTTASNGMDVLPIHRYKLAEIEDTLRITSNIHHSQNEKTCHDRKVTKSWKWAREILSSPSKQIGEVSDEAVQKVQHIILDNDPYLSGMDYETRIKAANEIIVALTKLTKTQE